MLIDDISKPNFMSRFFPSQDVQLDLNKLIMAGHSMGGAAAVRTAEADQRVKCLLTLDAWTWPVSREIGSDSYEGMKERDLPVFLLNTGSFFPYCNQIDKKFDAKKCHERLRDVVMSDCQVQDIILEGAHHFH